MNDLLQIMARLRAPDGCPWDQEQTHDSIKGNLLEECYEVLEAIEERDDKLLQEELGDVLLSIVFHAQIATEEGRFTFDDVARTVSEKMVRRHPHVFGSDEEIGSLGTSDAVLSQWDQIKAQEKPERTGALSGVPLALPSLMLCQELGKKAAKVGFDWSDVRGVLDKVKEEVAEVEAELDAIKQDGDKPEHLENLKEEIGDLCFIAANLARKCQVDAEDTARLAGRKFKRRFEQMEALAQSNGQDLKDMTVDQMEGLWVQVKKTEKEQKATKSSEGSSSNS